MSTIIRAVRMDAALWEKVQARAKKLNVSANKMAVRLLEAALRGIDG